MKDEFYYLDAITEDEEYRITTFSYSIDDLVMDLARWMRELCILFSQLKYAIIFRSSDDEPVADLVSDDGVVSVVPREPNRSIAHKLRLMLRRIRNRI